MKIILAIGILCLLAAGCSARRPLTSPPDPPSKAREVLRVMEELAEIAVVFGADNSWGRHCLPEHLRARKHDDWPPPLNLVPRWANAFCGVEPVWGEGSARKPIPPPGQGTWHLVDQAGHQRPYYALTSESCLHFRVGFRWDDVDGYYNLILPWMATFRRMPDCNQTPSTRQE